MAHQANSLAEAKACLAMGVNGLEVDVNVYARDPRALCIAHGPMIGTGPGNDHAIGFAEFLSQLRPLIADSRLALIFFDCKPPVASAQLGHKILEDIRTCLEPSSPGNRRIRVVLSVPTRKYAAMLTALHPRLRAHELAMIDQEWQPQRVVDHFARHSIQRYGTGNGSSVANGFLTAFWPSLRRSVREACRLRGNAQGPAFVSTFTVNRERAMRRYLAFGVDGIMSDRVPPLHNRGAGLARLCRLVEQEGPALGVRLATPEDAVFTAFRGTSHLLQHENAP
jgi:hypothetical protein